MARESLWRRVSMSSGSLSDETRLASPHGRRRSAVFGGAIALIAVAAVAGYFAWRHYSARSLFQAALDAYRRREWMEANERIQDYLHSRPENPGGLLLAARVSRRLKRSNDARNLLDACEGAQGGETQEIRIERALLRLQRDDLSVEEFLREAARDPALAGEILDPLSEALIRDLRLAEAHACLGDLLRLDPDNFDMLVRHAYTAEAQTWYSVEVDSLQRAIKLRPDANETRLSLAQALIASASYPEARRHLNELRQKEPKNPAVAFALARCLAYHGEKEEAARLLDDLLAAEPQNPLLLGERGWVSLELDRPAEADPFLRRARSLAPPDKALLTRLANCLRLLGKEDEARQCRDEAERLLAATQKTSDLTSRIRDEKPAAPELYCALATAYVQLGREREALLYFQKALEKNPKYHPAHEALARLYESHGEVEKAALHRRLLGPQ